jgi:hypothetical protein
LRREGHEGRMGGRERGIREGNEGKSGRREGEEEKTLRVKWENERFKDVGMKGEGEEEGYRARTYM